MLSSSPFAPHRLGVFPFHFSPICGFIAPCHIRTTSLFSQCSHKNMFSIPMHYLYTTSFVGGKKLLLSRNTQHRKQDTPKITASQSVQEKESLFPDPDDRTFGLSIQGDKILASSFNEKSYFNFITETKMQTLPETKNSVSCAASKSHSLPRKSKTETVIDHKDIASFPYHEILKSLNADQLKAVLHPLDQPCIVQAGPGSGKTRVLIHRVLHLIHNMDVDPRSILLVTFSNKAANELKNRVRKASQILSNSAVENNASLDGADENASGFFSRMAVGTFHSVSVRILRQYGHHIGIPDNFVIYDRDDQKGIISNFRKKNLLNIFGDLDIFDLLSKWKLAKAARDEKALEKLFKKKVHELAHLYQQELDKASALDFDDLLIATQVLLEYHEGVRTALQHRWKYILVDEWQDTSVVQYEIIKLIAAAHKSVFIVGDEDQSIYSWRRACKENVFNFQQYFKVREPLYLSRNYRSTKVIVSASQSLIEKNKDRFPKKLQTQNPTGNSLIVLEAESSRDEAEFLCNAIIELVIDKQKCKYSDIGVLYRTNFESRTIEEHFVRKRIPYRIIGDINFYNRKEVKDICAYIRYINNPNDLQAFQRIVNVPMRGIGDKTVENFLDFIRESKLSPKDALEYLCDNGNDVNSTGVQHQLKKAQISSLTKFYAVYRSIVDKFTSETPVADLVRDIINKTGYLNYLQELARKDETSSDKLDTWNANIAEVSRAAEQYEKGCSGLQSFMDNISLMSHEAEDGEDKKVNRDAVQALTLHSSKGLEFKAVFIVGVEDTNLPHFNSHVDPSRIEEERRLLFVGITRAKQYVYLSWKNTSWARTQGGFKSKPLKPSRFLAEIPDMFKRTFRF